MQVFFDAFASVLSFFYDLVPNYAFAIVMLTLVVMIIVTPLTLKGTRSMMMMQQLQPEMRKIQTRYKDDRQKLNEELLKFYKENSINPLGGCLPLLVQMPVFLVLYQVLSGLTRRESGLGFDTGWISSQASQGADLAESASKALSSGILHAIPYLVLIAIVAATGFIQQRQIQGRNPNAQINPQQQMIMKIMPIFLPVISFGLPAGLVLYFAVSNMYRIGQQAFISRSIYGMKKGQASVLARSGGGAEPAEAPSQSFREAFGLARRDAKEVGERKAKAKASAKTTNKATSSKNGGGTARAKSPAKTASPTKGASRTTPTRGGSNAAKGKPADTRSANKDTGGGGQPILQPRARKNQKKR
jgi:YidC/Oxa1 family membrane protein insertase